MSGAEITTDIPARIDRLPWSNFHLLVVVALGVTAINTLAKTGKKPAATPGLGFYNTGTQLYTNSPIAGVKSITTTQEASVCWKA